MARRSDHTRKELKEMAIKVGRSIISTEGLGQLSTRKVTKEIGYSVGTFYQLFDNYDDYILHLNNKTLLEILNSIEKITKDNYSTKSLKEIANIYINYSNNHYNNWSALFEHKLQEGTLPNWYNEPLFKIFLIIEKCLEQYNLTDKAKTDASRVLWSGLHGITLLGVTGKLEAVKSTDSKDLAENFLNNYLKGLINEKNN